MIDFKQQIDCHDCSLWESANLKSVGLPTRSLYDNQEIIKEKVVLFVGQNPGYNENKVAKSFVGYTGKLLGRFIDAAHLTNYADIYLANACRCCSPQDGDISQSQIRACRKYLIADLNLLREQYKEVVIVALGAKACYSVMNLSSLTEGFKKQGMRTILRSAEDDKQSRVFFTNHPAILHPTRQPAKVHAVQAHFGMLLRYLKGQFIPNTLDVNLTVGAPVPIWFSHRVSMDIETYGILAGKEQTVFNPHKSKYVDGIDYPDQIVTISFHGETQRGSYIQPCINGMSSPIEDWCAYGSA